MVDRLSPEERSHMMGRIRGCNTTSERLVRKALYAAGLRYRLHSLALPGRPDIVFPARRAVIFVHGCFWHRHQGCTLAYTPKSRPDFWKSKFDANVARDRRQIAELEAQGWRVLTVWECVLRSQQCREAALATVCQWVREGAHSSAVPR